MNKDMERKHSIILLNQLTKSLEIAGNGVKNNRAHHSTSTTRRTVSVNITFNIIVKEISIVFLVIF